MKFQRKLKVKKPGEYQFFERLKAGRFELSVQGSTLHYCSPRASLPADEYRRMEVAIFKDGDWVYPNLDRPLRHFPWAHWFECMHERNDRDARQIPRRSTSVALGVPVETIQQMYDDLERLLLWPIHAWAAVLAIFIALVAIIQ